MNRLAIDSALKLQRNASKVTPEGHNVQPPDLSRQIHWGASLAEGNDLIDAVQILGQPHADGMRGTPEKVRECLYVISNQSRFVARIECSQLGDGVEIIDEQD
jgi:hypothetical protein